MAIVCAAQFFKMLRIGVPKGGVKQKMRQAGLNPEVIDQDPDKALPPSLGGAAPAASTPGAAADARPKVIRKRINWQGITVRVRLSP